MADLPPKPETIYAKARRHLERRKKGPTARRRAAKRRTGKAGEVANMRQARIRDAYCRFPVCGCVLSQSLPHRLIGELIAEVSHQVHRGMGGDPRGERTTPPLLLLLCNWRHKLSKFSIDRHGIRWEALTEQGADGPIRWLIDAEKASALSLEREGVGLFRTLSPWIVLAEETAPHAFKPFTEAQSAILAWLAEMSV